MPITVADVLVALDGCYAAKCPTKVHFLLVLLFLVELQTIFKHPGAGVLVNVPVPSPPSFYATVVSEVAIEV